MEYEKIKQLMDDMGNSKLTSIDIDFPDGTKISMKKDSGKVQNTKTEIINECQKHEIAIPVNVPNIANNSVNEEQVYKYIKSPMVGTFYSKPSPDEESYINVGETIKKGSTTCIIEAMKLMNEIEAEFDGEVVEILKKDGEPVEYGENLIKLK